MGCCGGINGCKQATSHGYAEEVSVKQVEKVEEPKETKVEYSNGDYIVIQFSAVWCGPCRSMKSAIKQYEPIQKFFKENTKGYYVVDIDDPKPIPRAWTKLVQPTTVPTSVVFKYKDGKWTEAKKISGAMGGSQMLQWLKETIRE